MTILRFGDVCQVPKINKKDSIADRILVFHAKIYVFYFLCLNILNEIENKAGLDFISPGLSFFLFIYLYFYTVIKLPFERNHTPLQ